MATGDAVSQLARMAASVEDDRFFVASALAVYRDDMRLGADDLAAYLGCAADALPRLALCRRPREDSPVYRDEIERIAAFVGATPARLANIMRHADLAQRRDHSSTRGGLMAARDRRSEDVAQNHAGSDPSTDGPPADGQQPT